MRKIVTYVPMISMALLDNRVRIQIKVRIPILVQVH